jgi:hypothetical protein
VLRCELSGRNNVGRPRKRWINEVAAGSLSCSFKKGEEQEEDRFCGSGPGLWLWFVGCRRVREIAKSEC